jgi:hypothetical protein
LKDEDGSALRDRVPERQPPQAVLPTVRSRRVAVIAPPNLGGVPEEERDAVLPRTEPPVPGVAPASEPRPAPEPVQSDEVRVILVGTVVFALGLVVTLVAHGRLEDDGHGDWVWIMLCGVALGVLGTWVVSRRRDALRRAAGQPADDRDEA